MRFAHNGITPSAPERFLCHEVDSYSFMNPKVRMVQGERLLTPAEHDVDFIGLLH
jgi:hypothetical protein